MQGDCLETERYWLSVSTSVAEMYDVHRAVKLRLIRAYQA